MRALKLGFEAAGIAAVEPLAARAHFEAWLAAGRHGGMSYLAGHKHRERRAEPARILPEIRTVVCVALCHDPAREAARDRRLGRIARYAAGEDYHRVMRDRLRALQRFIREDALPGARALWYSDTGAILERGWAERCGLGWIGKHTGLLSERFGSWFLLGEILVNRPLDPDPPLARERCGTCTRCIEACPTGAIVAPYQLDARLCISYLTIELEGAIPRDLRPLVGDWIFGCDVCQEEPLRAPGARGAAPRPEARGLDARALPHARRARLRRAVRGEPDPACFARRLPAQRVRGARQSRRGRRRARARSCAGVGSGCACARARSMGAGRDRAPRRRRERGARAGGRRAGAA